MSEIGTFSLGPSRNARGDSTYMGMLKKAASGVLAILPCSRTPCTLRASKWLRPCWTDPSERLRACFFEHSLPPMMSVSSRACICHWREIFNSLLHETTTVTSMYVLTYKRRTEIGIQFRRVESRRKRSGGFEARGLSREAGRNTEVPEDQLGTLRSITAGLKSPSEAAEAKARSGHPMLFSSGFSCGAAGSSCAAE